MTGRTVFAATFLAALALGALMMGLSDPETEEEKTMIRMALNEVPGEIMKSLQVIAREMEE